jgi:N utilization substance protein B
MSKRRDTRRLAMQVLYQLDMRGEDDAPTLRAALEDGSDSPEVAQAAFDLAWAAWKAHPMICDLAPRWPTYRQPPVDRAILRLAYYELTSGHAPLRVVLDEAIELAKEYSTEHSPSFVNGVLDKVAHRLGTADVADSPHSVPDPWLADALSDEQGPGDVPDQP